MKTKLLLIIAAVFMAYSCSDNDDEQVKLYDVNVTLQLADDVQGLTRSNEKYVFKNVASDRSYEFTTPTGIQLPTGLYDVTYTAEVTMSNGAVSKVRAFKQSVQITETTSSIELQTYNSIDSDDLIIAEIFFPGTLTPAGKQYTGDGYVKLYNNSDHVIYADGLTLFETAYNTAMKYDYTPDIMNEAVSAEAIYTVPGNGTQYPVQPGEYFIMADNAIDHRETNANSFDLSGANVEWYDESSNPKFLDLDNPNVTNMDKWYCYTLTIWALHNRGYHAFGIARIPVDKDTFLANNYYEYSYDIVTSAGTFPMSNDAYKIPNEYVVDVVNCCEKEAFEWIVTSPALDMGWTYVGTTQSDKTRYFHSVRRKMLYLNAEGNPVFKDTNNSTEDFNPYCIASLIEEQGTAMDADGTPCTTKTYDGVTPMQ